MLFASVMNRSKWLLIAVTALLLAVPLNALSLDAATSSDVTVSIQGYDVDPLTEEVKVDLESGKSVRLTMFVVNKSDSRYSIYIESTSSSDKDVGVSPVDVSPTILKPAGSSDSSDIAYLFFTMKADSYMNSGSRSVPLVLHLQNLDDSSFATVEMTLAVTVKSATDTGDCFNKFFGIIPNTLPGDLSKPFVTAFISFVLIVFIMWCISLLIIPAILSVLRVKRSGEDYTHLKRGVVAMTMVASFVFAFNQALLIYGVSLDFYYSIQTISKVIYTLAGAMLAWYVYMFIVLRVVGGVEKTINNEDSSLIPLFKLLGRLIIAVFTVTFILASFGVDLAGLLVSAGVVSLGITLGAQNILGQFFSGLILLATRPFKAGDFIQIGDDVFIVRKVRLMYTEFANWGKDQIVTMPNNTVASAKIINLTRGNKVAKINVFVSVSYDTDIPKAKALMLEAANKHPNVILDGSFSEPSVTLTEWLDSGIQLRLSCYVDDFDSSKGIMGDLREVITQSFRDNGIEIPYSRVQIDILSDSTQS